MRELGRCCSIIKMQIQYWRANSARVQRRRSEISRHSLDPRLVSALCHRSLGQCGSCGRRAGESGQVARNGIYASRATWCSRPLLRAFSQSERSAFSRIAVLALARRPPKDDPAARLQCGLSAIAKLPLAKGCSRTHALSTKVGLSAKFQIYRAHVFPEGKREKVGEGKASRQGLRLDKFLDRSTKHSSRWLTVYHSLHLSDSRPNLFVSLIYHSSPT